MAAPHNESGVTLVTPVSRSFEPSPFEDGAQVHRYLVLIAPQLAIRMLEPAVALGALAVLAALELVVTRAAAPMTEHRYISFVGVSVISPLAKAAAISLSEKSWWGA